jgi:hypothetical protein
MKAHNSAFRKTIFQGPPKLVPRHRVLHASRCTHSALRLRRARWIIGDTVLNPQIALRLIRLPSAVWRGVGRIGVAIIGFWE